MSSTMEVIKKLNVQKFLINLDEALTDVERHGENIEWYLMRIDDKLDTIIEELGGDKDESQDKHHS